MRSETQKLLVYQLGEGYGTTSEGKPLYSWPYTVHYTPGYEGGDFYLGEGDARNGGGTFSQTAQMLQPQWRRNLELAGVLWLLPLLERMASGEHVEVTEILQAYQQIHGTPPASEEWHLQR